VDVKGAQEGDDCEVIDAIVAGEFDKLIDKNSDGTFNKLLEKVVIKVLAKVTRKKHLKVSATDVTPARLECKLESAVVEEQGLDIPEEMIVDP